MLTFNRASNANCIDVFWNGKYVGSLKDDEAQQVVDSLRDLGDRVY